MTLTLERPTAFDEPCYCGHPQSDHPDGPCISQTTDVGGGYIGRYPCDCEAFRDTSGLEGPTYDAPPDWMRR